MEASAEGKTGSSACKRSSFIMTVLVCAIILFPLFFGMGILTFMNRKKVNHSVYPAEAYVCGFVCCIGIFAAGHLAGVFMDRSVSFCGKIIIGLLAVLTAFSVVSIAAGLRKKQFLSKPMGGMCRDKMAAGGAIMFAALAAVQIYIICAGSAPQAAGDITLETVNSFLVSDGIYTVSPLTGKPYGGPPLRYEILCLPTVYTLLCRWFNLAPDLLVNKIIPLVVMGTAFLAYSLLGSALFGREKASAGKRMWFLVIVAAVFLLCEGYVYMEGYGILHAGHLGTTWRNSILVPFALSAALKKKWWQALICILAEVCIAWTLWGLGVCLVFTAGVAAIGFCRSFCENKGRFSQIFEKEENGL